MDSCCQRENWHVATQICLMFYETASVLYFIGLFSVFVGTKILYLTELFYLLNRLAGMQRTFQRFEFYI
jgi:hypothetical protein